MTPSKRKGVRAEPTADQEPTEIAVGHEPWDASSLSDEIDAATIHDGLLDDDGEPVVDETPSVNPTDHVPIPNKPKGVITTGDLPPRAQAAPSPEDTPLQSGTMLGDYRIEAQIGEGGMGVVYAAVHPLIGKRAAVKVLKAELCRAAFNVERFIDEARIVNQIGHPNIVDVFAFGQTRDGRSYFVMEWLKGESLRTRIARARLDFSEICDVVRPLARALEAAHEQGVIHRDLKPDNIFLVDRRGEAPTVKLLDFGIAKLVKQEHRLERTATGAMVGTPQYIAPEQAKGYAIDARVDIYALGGILFELLTGRPPYVADNAMELVAKHLMEAVPHPATLAEIPAELDDLVVRMLSKHADGRPSLAEVAAIIERTSALDRTNVKPRSRAATPAPIVPAPAFAPSAFVSSPVNVPAPAPTPTPMPTSRPALDALAMGGKAVPVISRGQEDIDLTETIRSPGSPHVTGPSATLVALLGLGFVVAAAIAYVVVRQLDAPTQSATSNGAAVGATDGDAPPGGSSGEKLGGGAGGKPADGDAKYGDAKSGGTARSGGDAKSGGATSGGATSGDAKSGDAKSGGATSGDATSGDATSGDATSGDAKSGGAAKSGDAKSRGATSGDATSGDAKSGGTAKSGDAKSGGTAKSGDAKSGGTARSGGDATSGGATSGVAKSGDSKSGGAAKSGSASVKPGEVSEKFGGGTTKSGAKPASDVGAKIDSMTDGKGKGTTTGKTAPKVEAGDVRSKQIRLGRLELTVHGAKGTPGVLIDERRAG